MLSTNVNRFPTFILSAYLWVGVFLKGYFFEVPFLVLNAVLYACLGYYWLRLSPVKVTPLHGFLALLLCLYWFSCLYAVDVEGALLEAARISSLLPLSILFGELAPKSRRSYLNQWAWAGAALVLWGWLFDLFRNGRLESTLEYANVLALLLVMGFWISLRAFADQRSWTYLCLAFIQLIGLTQTGSRAVFVLFGISALVVLIRMIKPMKPHVIMSFAAAMTAGLTIALLFSSREVFRLFELGWNSPELQLRIVYWKDAIRLIQENWYKGLGGGGWVVEQPSGYFVRYVHQHYLQVMLEIGLLGGLVFIGMAGYIIFCGYRNRAVAFGSTGLACLFFVHAFVDIDLLFPLCFGALVLLMCDIEQATQVPSYRWIYPKRWNGVTAGTILIAIAAVFGWLAVGYMFKWVAVKGTHERSLVYSINQLERAQAMIPWAHSVHYELSDLYLRQWEHSHNVQDYRTSVVELDKAIQLIPRYAKYNKRKDLLSRMETTE